MKKVTRWGAAGAFACCVWVSGCQSTESKYRALFKPAEKPGYVEGRLDEIQSLYWAQRNMVRKDPDPQLKRKLTEVVIPGHYDSDGQLIETHREVIEVVQ